ncbi:fungal transcriptional regulatory protein [Pochonia chlamydosporia 170]|uniref:Fungal transcriptional regulatory protein n=1 Tax=Pochonia chlamydosporia 170 TaxID=1380566 RepID=A0A179FM72_METCM|nr:fungal transcriptional regulatory protein [Pochonia chlamydosporia 170]OAQ66109.1 fungal transcriptional regulatory protein [Pochonia chlamydosporia 170]
MGSDSRPVCHRCAQIKQACDGSLPCARCVRLSLPCRPRNAAGTAEEAPNGDVPKARIRRVQTGCLMCKRRKKKCDETKPRCGDCRRLCLDCAWPPERHVKSKPGSGSPEDVIKEDVNGDNGIAAPVPTTKISGHQPSEMMMRDIPIRNSPSPSSSSSGRHDSYDSQSHRSHTSQNSQMGYSNYANFNRPLEQTPMMTVATTTMTMPSSTAMPVTSGIIGELTPDMSPQKLSWDMSASSPIWLDSVTPISNGSPTASIDSVPPAQSLSIYVPQLMPQLSAPQDKALLNHYSTIVSSILSRRSSTENPYNGYLLPMAQSNDLVLHCILALSANHWRKLQPAMGDRGLLHKSKATQALAGLLPHVDTTSADIALVSSLLLCMTELFDGTSEGWKLHLKGAKRLLVTLRKQQGDMMTGHYKFLLRLARFLDSAATTSTCRPPLMGDEAAEAQALDSWSATPDEEDSAVYGIPKELFHLVDRVNTLAELRSTRVDQASEAAFRRHANEIEHRINNWSYEYGGMSRAVSTLTPTTEDVLHATLAFEYAIRLRLHQIVEGYELTDPKVGKYVEGILDCVQKIRYGSPLESCILFPLVMAGGSCWKLEHRVVIQDRLLVMERTCGFGYIYNARDLVERVWSRRDQSEGTGAIVNWARIRYYEMHGLVVF